MGLRRALRDALLARRMTVPLALVRPKERPLYAELNRLRPGDLVIDLGANVGRTVRLFAQRGCVVQGYEPNPDAFARLRSAVGSMPHVTLVQAAVGEAPGTARLYLHRGYDAGSDHLESSSLIVDKPNVDPDRFVDVPVLDAAEVVAAAPGRVAFMKIDVEGAEYGILHRLITSGATERIDRIAVETHADRIESLRAAHAEIEALIAARGLGAKIVFGWE
jgi:FkbM family methyltransferase